MGVVPYLVQANLEHWQETTKCRDLQESRPRIKLCKRHLEEHLDSMSIDKLWRLLFTHPVWERGVTLYCCVMSVEQGELLAQSVKEQNQSARMSTNNAKRKRKKNNK